MVKVKKSEINQAYVKVCTTVLDGIKSYFSEKLKQEITNEDVINILEEIYCSEDTVKKPGYNYQQNGQVYIS